MQTIKTNGLNLDALKADIANNEIRVLVNGQPETVDFKQWCRTIGENINVHHETIRDIIEYFSKGHLPKTADSKYIYSQLDY